MPSLIEPVSLEYLREARDLSRAWLAERLDVHAQTVAKWERRERGMGADDLRACARVLELSDAEELALLRWAASVESA